MCRWIKKSFILFWTAALLTCVFSGSSYAFDYEAHGRRDPFVPLVGITETSSVSGAKGILTIEDVSLQGIVMGPKGGRAVVINGELMYEGQRVERLLIESIGDNIVMIKIDEERYYLKLYE
jgi:hypothetical protein